ncbi:tetratricopeptide repeat protein [Kaarinaea lacus]
MRLRYFLLFLVLMLSACASEQKLETLADLGEADIQIESDVPVTGARDKAMDNYWEFMAGAKERQQKVEAMRRLADLEMERAEERFQKQMEVFGNGKEAPGTDVQSLKDITYRGAIKLYEDALKASGRGPQTEGLLYQISKAYEQAGQQDKALVALTNLLEVAPNAENRDELYFRQGELLFDLRKFKQAEYAYSQAMLVSPNSIYYEKAMTKRGWATFKQENYQQALGYFLDFVNRKLRLAEKDPKTGEPKLSRGDKELVDDAFRAVTLSLNELGGAKAVRTYFEKTGQKNYEIRIYNQLAEFYIDKERIKDAADTYSTFPEVYPMHEKAFDFDLKAIDTFASAGFSSVLIEMKEAFLTKYKIKGEYWRHFEVKNPELLTKLRLALVKNSEDVVKHYHASAQKSKKMQDYQTAFLLYRQHLKWFGQSANAQKMNFLYAELLFEAKQYQLAATEYEKTAYQYKRFGGNAEAGYAAMLAYAELEKQSKGKQKETWGQMSVASAIRFGKKFPADKRAADVLLKAAQDMFALKKYSQASTTARQILELSSDERSPSRRIAWNIIARAEFEKGDYTRAEVAYKVALSLTDKKDKSRMSLQEGLAAAVYKQGEYMRSKGNLKAAIDQFNRVREVSPGSSINIAAEFDIATSKMDTKDWKGAITDLIAFRNKYPNHSLSSGISKNLITAYLETGQSLKAANELDSLVGSQNVSEQDKRAALWQAMELYEKSGTENQVVIAMKKYISMFPSPMEQATEVRQKLADIYQKNNRAEDRRYWLKEIIKHDKAEVAESTTRTQYLAARAALELAEPAMRSFRQVKLVKPLKANLKRKKEKMQEAVDAYTAAADYGIAEVTTASVYWLAEIYNEFGKELMESERPSGLSGEELEQYDILLEEQAYPFEEKSINIHESNISRIAEGAYDEWVKKSFDKLKGLNPVRYAKSEKANGVAALIYY